MTTNNAYSLPLPKEHARIFGIRVTAIIESLFGLVLLTLIDYFFFKGDRFWDVNPHPYWIVVLLVAAQYGTAEGLIAALLATLFYLVGNVPPQPEGMTHYDWIYSLALNPILWLIGGWILGELRQRHVRERNLLIREVDESHQREELIADSYKFVKGRKESLEVQVSGQLLSSIDAYRAAKAVETLDPKSVMQGVERLVKSVLGPQKFSLYIAYENKLSATIIHGWATSDKYSQEIDSYSPLYQAVVGQRDLLVVANEQQEISLDTQGILAGPILDPDGTRVIGMLKVEQMDFTSLSLNTVETFRALCEWIGTALVNARNYQSVKAEAIINPERNVLSYSYFKRQSEYMRTLAKRVNFDLSMLVIKLNDAKTLSDSDRITVARQINESVKSVLRSVDLAFDYQTDGEEFSILLPATNQSGASIVRDKIAKDMDKALRGKADVNFNYIVQALHEVR
ncbi:MAG: GAF domain-containing protein [Rickettsiales bacterium]